MRPSRFIPLVVALATFIAAPAAAQFGYEELARTTALTASDDYRIGKGYMDMVSWMYGTVEDPQVQADVEELVRRLVAASDRPDMVFNVVVVPDPTVNAAALPGGFMMINQGLIDALSPDEVAFVVAHEISHIQLRHFATTMNMTGAMEVITQGEAARAAEDHSRGTEVYEELSRMATRYSRTLELEADLYGLLYAMRAGYPAQAAVDAMETMKVSVGEIPEWMADDATHPTFSQRITELQAGTQTVTETYGLFDAGVAYARAGEFEAAIPAFQQFLTLFPKSSAGWSNLGTCYLHEAIKSRTDDPWHDDLPLYLKADVTVRAAGGVDRIQLERARDAFARALELDPNRDAALGNLGVLARIEGDYEGAVALIDKARELDGDYAGYMNNLGNVYAAQGDLKKADKWWGKALKADKDALYAKANRARGYAERGKTKDAVALYEELLGQRGFYEEAHAQLVALGARPAGSQPEPIAAPERRAEDDSLVVLLGGEVGTSDGGGQRELPTPEPVEAPAEPTTAEPTTAEAGQPDDDTKFGNVGLGQSLATMTKILGEPDFADSQEDGYFVYASWWEQGVSVVFTDDVSTSVEIFPPGEAHTGRGVKLGSTEDQVLQAYGAPDSVFGDRNAGYEAWSYDSLGHAFYLDESAQVVSISMWSM